MAFSANMKTWCGAWLVATWWCVAMASDCKIPIGDGTYREETLVSGFQGPQRMAVDSSTRSLYFTCSNGSRINVKLDLGSKACSIITELSGICTFTADQVRGRVYAGCDTLYDAPGGLYERDSTTGRFYLAGESGRNFQFVHYYNDTLYYSFYPGHLLHTMNYAHSVQVSTPEWVVRGLVVAANGDYVFKNSTGVYRRRGDGTEQTVFDHWVWTLAVDNSGAVYTCSPYTPRGIWRLHDRMPTATRLLDVSCLGLTFDNDDIIYGDRDHESIVRLMKC